MIFWYKKLILFSQEFKFRRNLNFVGNIKNYMISFKKTKVNFEISEARPFKEDL